MKALSLKFRVFFASPPLPSILWCSHTCEIIHKRELAKFGYRLERKVEQFMNPAIYFGDLLEPTVQKWQLYQKQNSSNFVDFGTFFFSCFSFFFFPQKSFALVSLDLFSSPSAKKFPGKKKKKLPRIYFF